MIERFARAALVVMLGGVLPVAAATPAQAVSASPTAGIPESCRATVDAPYQDGGYIWFEAEFVDCGDQRPRAANIQLNRERWFGTEPVVDEFVPFRSGNRLVYWWDCTGAGTYDYTTRLFANNDSRFKFEITSTSDPVRITC